MQSFKRILVPVDLSNECQPAISMAERLASDSDAELVFCYVAIPPLTADMLYAQVEYVAVINHEREDFEKIAPSDPSIRYSHAFLNGNPGPEIVRIAKESGCDLVVITTHGRSGIARLVLGSVAEYVIRNSTVPVVTVKTPTDSAVAAEVPPKAEADILIGSNSQAPFVTSVMKHAPPVQELDEMPDVMQELSLAHSSAAPVVDRAGKCIGILTETDVEKYVDVWRRFDAKDKSVLDEIYETDEFGMRRVNHKPFQLVKKHMTSPVITIRNDLRCNEAAEVFERNCGIHHLVVVDAAGKPLGIVKPDQVLPKQVFDFQPEAVVS